jgi:hypothetical protein
MFQAYVLRAYSTHTLEVCIKKIAFHKSKLEMNLIMFSPISKLEILLCHPSLYMCITIEGV